MILHNGKISLGGYEDIENPLDTSPYSKRLGRYREWKEGERTSYRAIWIDRYTVESNGAVGFESLELKISNRGKCFLNDKELKKSEDISTVKEIFSQIKTE